MKKIIKRTFLFIMPLLVIGCAKPADKEREQEDDPVVIDDSKKVSELEEKDYLSFPSYLVNRLNKSTSYKAVTSGQTTAKVLFITTVQSIEVTTIKSEYSYVKNESHSDLVNTVHEAYYHDQKALYKDNNEENFHLVDISDYLNTYGTYPLDNAIEGYLINEESILEVKKLESETDYKFQISFNPEKATNNVKIQMRKFGELDDYPRFSQISMVVTVKEDFTPTKLELASDYVAAKFVDSNCHQEYTVTYSDFNQQIEVPNLEQVKDKFNA